MRIEWDESKKDDLQFRLDYCKSQVNYYTRMVGFEKVVSHFKQSAKKYEKKLTQRP